MNSLFIKHNLFIENMYVLRALSTLRGLRTFAVRETASLGIMGAPRVPPLNPSESIVLSVTRTTARLIVAVFPVWYTAPFCVRFPRNSRKIWRALTNISLSVHKDRQGVSELTHCPRCLAYTTRCTIEYKTSINLFCYLSFNET